MLGISLSDAVKAGVLFFFFPLEVEVLVQTRGGVNAEGISDCGGLEMWVSGGRLVICLHPLNVGCWSISHDIQPPRKGVEVGPFFLRIPLAI